MSPQCPSHQVYKSSNRDHQRQKSYDVNPYATWTTIYMIFGLISHFFVFKKVLDVKSLDELSCTKVGCASLVCENFLKKNSSMCLLILACSSPKKFS